MKHKTQERQAILRTLNCIADQERRLPVGKAVVAFSVACSNKK